MEIITIGSVLSFGNHLGKFRCASSASCKFNYVSGRIVAVSAFLIRRQKFCMGGCVVSIVTCQNAAEYVEILCSIVSNIKHVRKDEKLKYLSNCAVILKNE